MSKNYVELKIKADPHFMINEAVQIGLGGGFYKCAKYIDIPLTDTQIEQLLKTQCDYVMNAISDLYYQDEDDDCA